MSSVLRSYALVLRTPAIVMVCYLLLHTLFGSLSEDGGLVTPEGSVSIGIVILGLLLLGLRLAVVFLLPAHTAYRIVRMLLSHS